MTEKNKTPIAEETEAPAEMATFFNARVDMYEEHMAQWKRHYKRIAELVPPTAQTLLDIGCGTGLELDGIFRRLPHLKVTGIDISRAMLEKLRCKYADKAPELICADYLRYDFKSECFDVAVAFETLHHFDIDTKTALFKKIFRALKSGGTFLECDYIAVSQQTEDSLFDEYRKIREKADIPENALIHFDTPLTLAHETKAVKNAGFIMCQTPQFLTGDDHTAIIAAVKP